MERLYGKAAEVHGQLMRLGKERRRIEAQEVRLIELPVIYDAMIEGEVDWSTGREITRIATPKTQVAWIEAVAGLGARQVEELCSGREEGDLPTSPRDESGRKRVVTVEMTAEQFAAFEAAKAKLVEERKSSVSNADAIEWMSKATLAEPTAQGKGVVVQSLLTMDRCVDCKRAWDTTAGRRIELDSSEIARRLCDSKLIYGAHVGADDAALTEAIPARLRAAVLARDGYRCSVPGCGCRNFLEVHHRRHISEGGTHCMENLITLCGNHHRAHHRGLLHITGPDAPLEFEFIDNVPSWIIRKFNLEDCYPS